MAKNLALNGLIHSKYESQSQLAEALGWPRQRLNKLVNGDKEPDLDEVKALSDALGEDLEHVAYIFLTASHQSGN